MFYRVSGEEVGENDIPAGFVSPSDTTTVFLNADSDKSFFWLLGHEVTHQLESADSELFAGLGFAVHQVTKNLPQYQLAKMAKGYSLHETQGELVSDAAGEFFTDPEFWREVAKHTRESQIQKLGFKVIAFF